MSRVPPVGRALLSPETQKCHDQMKEALSGPFAEAFVIRRNSDDAFVGPMPAFFVTPEMGSAIFQFSTALGKLPGLSPETRETVILAVGSHFKAAYELYAHMNVAEKLTKLTKTQVEQIAQGTKPTDLDEASGIAFDVALYLSSTAGPLPQSLWDRSVGSIGKPGTISIIHYAGFYAYTCMLLNGIDAPIPTSEGE